MRDRGVGSSSSVRACTLGKPLSDVNGTRAGRSERLRYELSFVPLSDLQCESSASAVARMAWMRLVRFQRVRGSVCCRLWCRSDEFGLYCGACC